MTNTDIIERIHNGHFQYWDMLGELQGIDNHKEREFRWLTGAITFNYYAKTDNVDTTVSRMKSGEIPNNLLIFANDFISDPAECFRKTGIFNETITTGMAHKLTDIKEPQSDDRLSVFRVRDTAQLKSAGAILNTVFDYRLFSLDYLEHMIRNPRQQFYMAEYDGIPAGALMSQYGDDFINISWVGTLPGYRKLGIAGRLIQMAESEACETGKSVGTLCAWPWAVGAYKHVGYKEYCRNFLLEMKGQDETK